MLALYLRSVCSGQLVTVTSLYLCSISLYLRFASLCLRSMLLYLQSVCNGQLQETLQHVTEKNYLNFCLAKNAPSSTIKIIQNLDKFWTLSKFLVYNTFTIKLLGLYVFKSSETCIIMFILYKESINFCNIDQVISGKKTRNKSAR